MSDIPLELRDLFVGCKPSLNSSCVTSYKSEISDDLQIRYWPSILGNRTFDIRFTYGAYHEFSIDEAIHMAALMYKLSDDIKHAYSMACELGWLKIICYQIYEQRSSK